MATLETRAGYIPASSGTLVGYRPAEATEDLSYDLTDERKVARHNEPGYAMLLTRIRATRDIPSAGVTKGDLGGWVQSTHLPDGTPRIQDNAWLFDNGELHGNAVLRGRAQARHSVTVRGNAILEDDARALNRVHIHGATLLRDRARASDQAELAGGDLSGDVIVAGDAKTFNHVRLSEHFRMDDAAQTFDRFAGFGHARLTGSAIGADDAMLGGDAVVSEYAHVGGEAFLSYGDRASGFERIHSNAVLIGDSIRIRKAA